MSFIFTGGFLLELMDDEEFDIESEIFPGKLPELDDDIRESLVDTLTSGTISPLSDAVDVFGDIVDNLSDGADRDVVVPADESSEIVFSEFDSLHGVDLVNKVKLYNKVFLDMLSYYKGIFPERFAGTYKIYMEKFEQLKDADVNDTVVSSDICSGIIDLIKRYHYEAVRFLNEATVRIIENSARKQLNELSDRKNAVSVIEAELDDFVDL